MKKLLALVLALVMTLGLATVGANAKGLDDFPDKASVNYEEAASVMHAVGIFMGDQNGEFRPTAQLTRAEAAKIIAYMMLGNTAAESVVPSGAKFKDVPASHWAAKYIEYLASVSIMQGDESGRANPDSPLTAIDFAKMLLVSLGYDPKVEGLVGVDYRINTSKLANMNSVKLFNGNPDVVATNPVTREEAALYTFNTIKAPLVEYSSKGSTLTVNGAELNFGASNYKYVVSTIAEEQRISRDKLTNTGTTSDGGYTVEFGERYYPKLKLISTDDDFGRPANKWVYDNKDVGTFIQKDKLIKAYTTGVKGSELFELLGKERIEAGKLTYKVDGVINNTIAQNNMVKGNTKDYDTTGKGVLTEVYGIGDDLRIVSINYYLAKADTDYNAAKDELKIYAYNTPNATACENAGTYGYQTIGTVGTITGIDQMRRELKTVKGEDFANAKEYKKDQPLMVTVASTDGGVNYDVKSLEVPTFTQNATVTKFSSLDPQSTKYLVTEGEQKDFGKKIYIAPDDNGEPNPIRRYSEENALTDYTYNIFYDKTGYVIGIMVYEGEAKYVFLSAINVSGNNLAANEGTGFLIFNDGTTKTAKINLSKTNSNIEAYQKRVTNKFDTNKGYPKIDNTTKNAASGAQYNMWFKYSVTNDVYTLTPVEYWLVRANQRETTVGTLGTGYPATPIAVNPAAAKVDGEWGRSAGNLTSGVNVSGYGNDDSVYITVESGKDSCSNGKADDRTIKKVTGTFTGLQKVDLKPFPQTDDKSLGDKAFDAANTAYTGGTVDGVDQRLQFKGGTFDGKTGSSGDVFAVLNGSNYIIAAVVVGESTGTANYAYVVKTALNEYVKDGKYYWEFQAIHEGELKTMTVKEEFDKAVSNKIQSLVGYYGKAPVDSYTVPAIFELKLDKDGFVIGADPVDSSYDKGTVAGVGTGKLYGQNSHNWASYEPGVSTGTYTGANPIDTNNKKLWETYNTGIVTTTNGAPAIASGNLVDIKAIGRTLYTVGRGNNIGGTSIAGMYDTGLTVAPNAPIWVIQQTQLRNANGTTRVKDDPSVESYTDLAAAVASLGDAVTDVPGTATTLGQQFRGVISAALDDVGRAKWLVIKSVTPVVIGARENSFVGAGVSTIGVTSANGSIGYPKENDRLQVIVPTGTTGFVNVTTVVGGAATTTVEYPVTIGGTTQLPIIVTAGVSYQVTESDGTGKNATTGNVTGGVAGTGIGTK